MYGQTDQLPTRALRLSWRAIRFLLILNWIYAGFIVALFVALIIAPDGTMTLLGVRTEVDRGPIYLGFRIVAVVGLVGAAVMHRVLKRIQAIVATVAAGDPFVPENATRLEDLARAVLVLELLHLVVGAVAAAVSTKEQPFDIDWSFSFTPWLAVLLLFVLARVFAEGTRLRRELEGVV